MAEQLIFDLPVKPALGREDFFVSEANAIAVATLEHVDSWPMFKQLLVGPEGSGKTHLAHVWAADTGAMIVQANRLNELDLSSISQPCSIENTDQIGKVDGGEDLLFHLHNILAEKRLPLLLTARMAPRDWELSLPDLASRMQATSVVRLNNPDEALLGAVMLKLFADRQLHVPVNLMPYLLRRMDRSFEAAHQLVEALDAAALRQNRPITRLLAAGVLDKLQTTDA